MSLQDTIKFYKLLPTYKHLAAKTQVPSVTVMRNNCTEHKVQDRFHQQVDLQAQAFSGLHACNSTYKCLSFLKRRKPLFGRIKHDMCQEHLGVNTH